VFTSIDLERAYATLGLSAGCSYSTALRRYKSMVKRWHPDRFARDPVRQAEACRRMQEINRAFELVKASIGGRIGETVDPRGATATSMSGTSTTFGRRLSDIEIDQISKAIGQPRLVEIASTYLAWGGAIASALLLLGYGGRLGGHRPSAIDVVVAVLLLCAAAVSIVRTMLRKRNP
jgi:hypothetical protein